MGTVVCVRRSVHDVGQVDKRSVAISKITRWVDGIFEKQALRF